MPDSSTAGSVGDPHLTRLDGTRFDFTGTPNATYNLLTHAGLAIHAAISGSGRVWHWGKLTLPAGGSIVLDERGLRRVEAGGWRVDAWRLKLADSGEPHLNFHVLERPADLAGATGLLVDGTAEADPAHYLVAPAPNGAELHGATRDNGRVDT